MQIAFDLPFDVNLNDDSDPATQAFVNAMQQTVSSMHFIIEFIYKNEYTPHKRIWELVLNYYVTEQQK